MKHWNQWDLKALKYKLLISYNMDNEQTGINLGGEQGRSSYGPCSGESRFYIIIIIIGVREEKDDTWTASDNSQDGAGLGGDTVFFKSQTRWLKNSVTRRPVCRNRA